MTQYLVEYFPVGAEPTTSVRFTDALNALADPTVTTLTIRKPDGTETSYTASPVVHDGTGLFHADVPLTQPGAWLWRWVGDGAVQAVAEGSWFAYSIFDSVGADSYTYDLATAVGKVRLLIQDTDLSAVSPGLRLEQRSAAFSDAELSAFLDMRAQDVYLTASLALRAWAANKQLIVITRKNGQGSVEYGTVRADMLKMAEGYETMAREQPADAYAEMDWDDFSFRHILDNAQLRSWNQ